MPTAVDLFAGCGGLSLGFQNAGHNILAALENWEDAIEVYKANFNHPVIQQDLSNVDASIAAIAPFAPQMIIGGPPCQDFSSAGLMNEDGARGNLTVCYANIIAGVRPLWFVMENVARIEKTNKLVQVRQIFKAAGYGLTEMVLDASRCGVPQSRKRFFMVGRIGEQDGFLRDTLLSGLAQSPMTVRDYFGNELGLDYYYRHPRSYTRRAIFSVDEPSPTIRGVNRPMPATYSLHPGDPVQTTDGIRCLTSQERSRIQTFPATFNFTGCKSDVEQMIGNAVPVNLANYVGTAINNYIQNNRNGQV